MPRAPAAAKPPIRTALQQNELNSLLPRQRTLTFHNPLDTHDSTLQEAIASALAAGSNCLALKKCTPEVWEKYKDKESTGPAKWTLARAINSGLMYPESFVGCHVGDAESYEDFADFYYPLIKVRRTTHRHTPMQMTFTSTHAWCLNDTKQIGTRLTTTDTVPPPPPTSLGVPQRVRP